jgi:GTPase SAR1 family protein
VNAGIGPSARGASTLERLGSCIADLLESGDVPAEQCRALQEKLVSGVFNLVVVGQFKRGKTSLINALIGQDLLPVGVVPLTSIVTLLSYGEKVTARVVYDDGREEEIALELLWEFATEKGNPKNAKRVGEVAVTCPSPWLKAGVRLVDTPGIGSVYRHNTDVALRFLPKADAVLVVFSADQPVSQSERELLGQVAGYAGKIFLLLNKADLLEDADLRECLAFTRQTVDKALGGGLSLFAVSARLAREARLTGSEEALRLSGFPAFTTALETFLAREKGNALVGSVARGLLRLVSQAHFSRDLALKALAAPLDELTGKLGRFEARKSELLGAKDEHAILMNGERERLLREIVEKDLEAFETGLVGQVASSVERRFEENRNLPSKGLVETLERQSVEEIRQAFDAWRATEDEKVSKSFAALCARLGGKLDAAIEELYRFSSELFSIPYETIKTDVLWTDESRFYYKFWQQPPSLYLLTSSAILALPKLIGDRIILRRARDAAIDAVRTQSGRVRYDFQQRLEKSALAFKARMSQNIEAVDQGLERALRETVSLRQSGEADADRRREAISASLQRLARARAQLAAILHELPDREPRS